MTWPLRTSLVAIVTLGAGLAAACASDRPSAEPATEAAAPEACPADLGTQEVALVGDNHCLGCALKKSEGAAAQCSAYGHRHALAVASAVGADGEPIPQLAGRTIHYLDNDASASLVSGEALHGERVEVSGRLFGPRAMIEVHDVREPR